MLSAALSRGAAVVRIGKARIWTTQRESATAAPVTDRPAQPSRHLELELQVTSHALPDSPLDLLSLSSYHTCSCHRTG